MTLLELLNERRSPRIPFGHNFEAEMEKRNLKLVKLDKLIYKVDNKIKIKIIKHLGQMNVYKINSNKLFKSVSIADEMDTIKKIRKILKEIK